MAYGNSGICSCKKKCCGLADDKASADDSNLFSLCLNIVVPDQGHNGFSRAGSCAVRNTCEDILHVPDIHEIRVLAGIYSPSHVLI